MKPKVSTVLRRLGACRESLAWVREQERQRPGVTLQALWMACPSGWWLDWIVGRLRMSAALRWRTWGAVCESEGHTSAAVRRAVGWLHWPAIREAFERAAREVRS